MIQNWWPRDKRGLPPQEVAFVRDAYDDCIAHLDEQLGRLFDELGRRGVLERTWVIVAADHGESFGEHEGVFCHGTSLYQTEVHVPFLVIPRAERSGRRAGVVKETVSLRNLPATIIDVLGLASVSPFPGESMARFWKETDLNRPTKATDSPLAVTADRALSEVVPNDPLNPDPAVAQTSVAAGGPGRSRLEIHSARGDTHEELFHLRDDAQERQNLAGQTGRTAGARADAGR